MPLFSIEIDGFGAQYVRVERLTPVGKLDEDLANRFLEPSSHNRRSSALAEIAALRTARTSGEKLLRCSAYSDHPSKVDALSLVGDAPVRQTEAQRGCRMMTQLML